MKSLNKWEFQSSALQILYVALGGISIIAPLVVAGFTDLIGDFLTRLFSFFSAVAVGIIGGFKLSTQANEMRRAYVELRSIVVRYEACDDFTVEDLVIEYIKLSRTIGSIRGPQADDAKITKELEANSK
ncbi:MAG: hypothetical protein A3J28_01645 [Acidobacteria bacterium RIFCSPLOWO2_12_FULL_60_22]|nr:MAG: hypothetical protein A3J28_01645 [Acidobacteria bacterium RIFCSPLOWO2_12_FULL_60_22]